MTMTAERHITSMLRRVADLQGRALTPIETATVLATLMEWRALLAAGIPPEAVVAIARQEVEAHAVH